MIFSATLECIVKAIPFLLTVNKNSSEQYDFQVSLVEAHLWAPPMLHTNVEF